MTTSTPDGSSTITAASTEKSDDDPLPAEKRLFDTLFECAPVTVQYDDESAVHHALHLAEEPGSSERLKYDVRFRNRLAFL